MRPRKKLVFTYMTSLLFFVEDASLFHEDAMTSDVTLGVLMILANCVAFFLISLTGRVVL